MGEVGRVALTITGTIVGSFFGQPGLGAVVGSAVGGVIFPGDRPAAEGPRLDDLQVQISSYGAAIPILHGTMRIAGNVIWSAPLKEIRSDTEEGGKGGVTLTEYRYFGTFAVAVCAGPIDKILRIWADTKLIYNVTGTQSEEDASGGMAPQRRVRRSNALQNMHIYIGDETQEPDIWIESYEGAGNVPAHRGLCYVVFKDLALGDYGNRIPNMSFEVSTSTTEITPYDELTGVIDVGASDNIVFSNDDMYFYIEKNKKWRKINTLSLEVEAEAEFDDIPDQSDFDIDQNNYIYTSKEYVSGSSKIVKLTASLDEQSGLSSTVDTPWRIKVGRSRHCEWIAVITDNGDSLEVTSKIDFEFDNRKGWLSIDPVFSYVNYVSVDFNHSNGDIWALCKDIDDVSTYSIIVHIQVDRNWSYDLDYWVKTSDIEKADSILYDADTNQVIIGSVADDKVCFYDADTLNKLGEIDGNCIGSNVKSAWRRGTYDGYLYYAESGNIIRRINVAKHEVDTTWTVTASSSLGTWNGGSCYDPVTHAVVIATSGDIFDYVKVYLDRSAADAVYVADAVDDICDKAGIDSYTEVDSSDINALTVHGYCINQRMTARAALQTLMDAFFFDGIESAGLLKFIERGNSTIVGINDADLGAYLIDSDPSQKLITMRQQEMELPQSVEVSYADYEANYQVGIQKESKITTLSQQVISLRLPMALSYTEAGKIANKFLYNLWMERNRHRVIVSREYAYLDPADVITINEDNNAHTVRIEQSNYQGGLIELNIVNEEASIYTSEAVGVPIPYEEEDVNWPGPTILALIDCPLLSSNTNEPGMYVATLGMTEAWTGAIVYKSNDDGATWHKWTISNRDAVIGNAGSVLGDVADPFVWDNGNSVVIRLYDAEDSLASDSEIDVLAGANHAILGDEIIGWTTVTLQSDGSYLLSGLLRGRNGTEWATGTHAVGETFVFLNTATIHFLPFPVEEKGLSREFVAISISMGWNTGTKQAFTCNIRNMMPLAPVHIKSTIDDSNNLTISWTRRVRYGGEWNDEGGPPLCETVESYEVDIYDDDGEIVNTLTCGEPTVEYTAAQQTADQLTPGDRVSIMVYQISSSVGRGFGTAAVVNDTRAEIDLDGKVATADGTAESIFWEEQDQTPP
jgi:hypothetical protein